MQPSLVKLPGASMPLADLLQAIEQQTGNKFCSRNPLGTQTGQLQVTPAEVPFWQALDAALDQAGLTTYHFTPNQELVLINAEQDGRLRCAHACYAGPLRFEAIRVDAHRQLTTPGNRGLHVTVEVAWEPRLKPIGLSQPLSAIRRVRSPGPASGAVRPANRVDSKCAGRYNGRPVANSVCPAAARYREDRATGRRAQRPDAERDRDVPLRATSGARTDRAAAAETPS